MDALHEDHLYGSRSPVLAAIHHSLENVPAGWVRQVLFHEEPEDRIALTVEVVDREQITDVIYRMGARISHATFRGDDDPDVVVADHVRAVTERMEEFYR